MADPISIPGAELVGPAASPAAAPPSIPGAEYLGPVQSAGASAAPAGGPAAYLAAHPGMDPLAVNEAFNQVQGKGAIPQGATPEQIAAARAQMQGGFSNFGNALGRGVARPIEGALGLLSPQAGRDVRQFNDLTYGPQTGAGGFLGEQAGNLVNAPYALTPAGRLLSAAEAMGNKRTDIAQQRAAGEDVGTGQEIARTAATGALDLGMNVVGSKVAGKMFGGNVAQPFLKRLAMDAAVNEGLSHAAQAGQNLIDNRSVTEGMGAGSFVSPLIQTAAFAGAHEAPSFLQRMRERASASAPTQVVPGVQSKSTEQQATPQAREQAGKGPEHTPENRQVSAATEDQILAAQKDFLDKRAANDPQADHMAATIQQHLADFEQAHGEDKAEDLIAKVQAMKHEPAAESNEHPERLENGKGVADWYRKTFGNDATSDLIETMAGHEPHVLADVPLDHAKPMNAQEGDFDQNKVDAISKLSDAERQKLPPAILGADGEVLDGTHRVMGRQAAGDQTIRAYVPEKSVGKNGIEAVSSKSSPEASAKPTTDLSNPLVHRAFEKMDAQALAEHGATPTTEGEKRGFAAFDKTLGQETKPPLRIAGGKESNQTQPAHAPAAKSGIFTRMQERKQAGGNAPHEMTLAQFKAVNNVHHDSMPEAHNATAPMDHPFFGGKIVKRTENAYSFTTPRGKELKYDVVKAERTPRGWTQPEMTRYVATAPGSDVPIAGVTYNHNINKLVAAHNADGKTGIIQHLLGHVKRDMGEVAGAEPMSAQGARALHRFHVADALTNGQPVSAEVLKDYPDLAAKSVEQKTQGAGRLSGGRRAGAIALPTHEDVAGPGSIYHEEVKPHLDKLATAGKEVWSGLKNLFPVETGAGDEKAQQVFREQFNRTSNEHFKVEDAFESARKGFDKMDPDDQQHFMRQMYDNQPQATPELQKIADAMYADTNEGRKALASLGHEAAKTWDDHKWNMLWKKDESKAQQILAATPNRPGKIEGKAGFLKKQTLNEFEDGLKQGLVPKYDNPVEMFLATKAERGKYVAGVRGMEQLVGNEQITRAKNRESIPAGWGEVPPAAKGPLTGIIANGPHADKLEGDGPLIAPEGVNRILKNITTPSALGNKAAFRLLMDANNTITQSMLGVSGFHIRKVAQELVNLSAARALDMGIKGQEGAGGEALRAVTSPFKAAMTGGEIQKMMLGQMQPQTPDQARVIDAMKSQFKARPDKEYETQWGRKFQKALDQGGLQGMIRAAAHAAPALNEKLMQKGVFSFVQRAKLYMGHEMVSDFIKQNPGAPHDDLMKETGKISDHLDNVLGLMNRDNLFWNRTARDLATLGTLSVGWNYGSGRALAGGIVDMGKGIGTLREGGKLSDIDTRRISYLATTGALTALTGAAVTYMATGKAPTKLRDFIFPPTGGKDRDGHDIRLNTGFYTTDYYDFFHDPIGTLSAKGSPLIHVATDLMRNKDYKGNKVFDTDEPWYKMAGQVAKYLGKSATPLSIQQLQDVIHGGGAGKSPLLQAAGFAGIKTAKRELSMSDAENAAHKILQGKQSAAGRDAEEGEKLGVKADLADQLRAKNPDARQHLQAALHKGQITPKDLHDIQKRSQEPVGLAGLLRSSQLDARDLMEKVWPKMTDDEKKASRLMVRRKIGDSNMTDDEKKSYWKRVGQ